jgi:hypothetical protein
VDGVAVVIGWDAIEPAIGQYQWALLDQWVGQAVSLGKKIALVIMAGASTPSWLFQVAPTGAGATPLSFTISPYPEQRPFVIRRRWPPPGIQRCSDGTVGKVYGSS